MWTRLKSELTEQIVEHVPLKLDHKPKKKDYISRATKKHMKRRSKGWKRYRQFRSGKNMRSTRRLEIIVIIIMQRLRRRMSVIR